MQSTRKFYKTTITITVLSERRLPLDLEEILFNDENVTEVDEVVTTHPNGLQMAQMLLAKDIPPRIFGLNEKGEDVNDA